MFYHKSTKIRKILKQRMTKLIKENNCWLTTCTEPNISTGSTFQHNDHYTTPENQLNKITVVLTEAVDSIKPI